MKRPLFIASLVITAIVFIYLEIFLSDYLMDYSDSFDGSTMEVTGIVADKGLKVDFRGDVISVVYITPVNASIGKNKYIALYLKGDESYVPMIGEAVRAQGRVRLFSVARNPGEFDESLYYATLKTAYGIKNAKILAKDGRKNIIGENLYRIRLSLEGILDGCLEYRDASIMKAILLGDKVFMDEDSKELYKNNGIIHILAVSGLHISLLGIGFFKLLRRARLRLFPASVTAILFMYMYGQMCGMSSSAFRAVAMFAMRMIAPLIGRTYDMLSALAVAELMLIIDQPLLVYNSGFLFSFGAILGIALVMPALEPAEDLYRKVAALVPCRFLTDIAGNNRMKFADDPKEPGWHKLLRKAFLGLKVSFSVFLVTLPVYMNFYFTYPIYSILLNLLILPMMAPLMLTGIVALAAGGISPVCGKVIGIGIHLFLKAFELLCNMAYQIPGKTWYMGHAESWKTWIYMLALVLFVLCKDFAIDMARYLILALAFLMLIVSPAPGLRITMMDVDQGDGILVQAGNNNILIDGGSTGKKNVGKYSIIPYLKYQGVGEINAAIITHEDEDHISGLLEIMDDHEKGGIRIKSLVMPDVALSCRGDNYHALEERAKELKIPVSYISCGQKLSFSNSKLSFLCINPEKNMQTEGANAYSTVLLMKYGTFSALFTGDVEEEGQRHILRDIRANPAIFSNITLLKVAHHGSMYTTDEEFLKLISPEIALISCGRENRYGHPHEELIKRLEKIGSVIYRTDESGAITINVRRNRLEINRCISDLDQ
ncbi:MAG: DNA internalization-related competence protein ComEC/Rec2 [Butyrivibrio sp.]|nr:DNA internalization-related competence protein ComEC/Rec2 [Butyrivibrio sp.]